MKDDIVTIVIPIYNVEKYLNRCIGSIVNQTYNNLQIILIDDGSSDRSPQICDEWSEKDGRIEVIHKKNEGQGIARNLGIEKARGSYICFFDSDDYVAADTIERAYQRIQEEKADVVVFGLTTIDASGNKGYSFIPGVGSRTYIGRQVLDDFLPEFIAPDPKGDGRRLFYMSCWVLLFSVDIIKKSNWRFVSEREIISEDVYSLLLLFKNVQRVAVLPESLYYYCDNGSSFSRKYTQDRYPRIKHFYLESLELCDRLGYGDFIRHRISKPYLAYTLGTLKQEATAEFPYKKRKLIIKDIINDDTLQHVLMQNQKDKVSLTRRIMFWAMRMRLYDVCMFLLKVRA